MPDEFTFRMQGGSFDSARGFFCYSPAIRSIDSFIAYEGSFSNGPLLNPPGYRRDNVSGNLMRRFGDKRQAALKLRVGRADSYSSGQLPTDRIDAGLLDRFGAVDHYRLDGTDPSLVAAGSTPADLWVSRRMSSAMDLNLGLDNLFNRPYWETQNYFESRLKGEEPVYRIHATPGYPRTVTVGMTLRFSHK